MLNVKCVIIGRGEASRRIVAAAKSPSHPANISHQAGL